MNVFEVFTSVWEQNRERTIALLDAIAETGDPQAVLAWRPGPGRAHIAWQIMHVAVTEELFASERLERGDVSIPDVVAAYRGGSVPADEVPTLAEIRETLASCRDRLSATISALSEGDLDRIPQPLAERGWTVRRVLWVLAWHEAHHHGQAHLTFNLWKQANGVD